MAEWGADYDNVATTREESTPGGVSSRLVDRVIATRSSHLLERAIEKALDARMKEIATEAVAQALGEDILAELERTAREEAEQALGASGDEAPAADTEEAGEPELVFSSCVDFFAEWLRFQYRRKINGKHVLWAADWWRSEEAVTRMTALWRAWEHLRLDGTTGMSVYFRDHLDVHMRVLMSPTGPLSHVPGAPELKTQLNEPLPHLSPPPGLFPPGI